MTCNRCRRKFEDGAPQCPYCGERRADRYGIFKTSTVLISCGSEEVVCRKVDEVPPHLRRRLLKCTNGGNSATILIADRRGRGEIARALRQLPVKAQRRLRRSVVGSPAVFSPLPPAVRRRGLLPLAILAFLTLIGTVFTYRW